MLALAWFLCIQNCVCISRCGREELNRRRLVVQQKCVCDHMVRTHIPLGAHTQLFVCAPNVGPLSRERALAIHSLSSLIIIAY